MTTLDAGLAARPAQAQTLEELLARVESMRESGRRPVLLFDIDDTLLSTAGRHLRILKEYWLQHLLDKRLKDQAARLARVEPWDLKYTITDTARAAGVTDETLLRDLRDYWFVRFFENEYIREDKAVPGAAEYCQEALVRGARLVYMTGRDVTMRSGTLTGLAENGFPMPDGEVVQLILKPSFDMPDVEFKTEALGRIPELGEVAGGFENEPAHINLFQEAYPSGLMVFVDTKHSGKPIQPRPEVRWIKDYRRDQKTR